MESDSGPLISALRRNAEALRINFEGYTSEVRYTDRVLRFPSLFSGGDTLAEPASPIETPDSSLLYSMATGDPGGAGYFPLNAVRWLTPPRDIAVLVTASAAKSFKAELFNFRTNTRPMSAEFYLLDPGKYELTIEAEGKPRRSIRFGVESRRTRVDFELPPRALCRLEIKGN
jgi:hypothetical protein